MIIVSVVKNSTSDAIAHVGYDNFNKITLFDYWNGLQIIIFTDITAGHKTWWFTENEPCTLYPLYSTYITHGTINKLVYVIVWLAVVFGINSSRNAGGKTVIVLGEILLQINPIYP